MATIDLADRNIKDFLSIQKYMLLAKEENAERTYQGLKDEYDYLKASLIALGINLTELDKIKE